MTINRDFFRGKRVTVFGLGLNSGGVGTVEFLVKRGVKEVVVTDIKTKEELSLSIAKLAAHKNVRFVLGQHRPEDFTHTDLVIKNPIVPWTNEYLKLAEKNGVPIEMDSSIFFALLPPVPVLGVTGTKGKTTTATLLAHLLESAGHKVVRVGIDRGPVLGRFGQVTKESVVVAELSSWRLSALHRLKRSPSLSLVTNIFPDHLNYYKSMEAYIKDKEAIFAYQKPTDRVILNQDDAVTRAMAERAPGQKYFFSQQETISPGAFFRDETVLFNLGKGEEKVFDYSMVKLAGKHNRSNVLSATLAAHLFGLSLTELERGVKSFSGLEHRLERVGEKKGVRYVNDSAATIPDAAMASLDSLDTPIILIAGGSDKGFPQTLLESFAQKISERTKDVILLKGDFSNRLEPLLAKARPAKSTMIVDDMEHAVRAASRLAASGDTVLLSPGATSFGLFQNEFERGERFRLAVEQVRAEH